MTSEPTASEDRRAARPMPGSPRRREVQRSGFVGWQHRSERGGEPWTDDAISPAEEPA
jgi:hypothetical protein